MNEGEVFAIETFPTTGNGKIINDIICNHYMIEYKYKNKINSLLKKNSKIREIYNNRLSLAFCPRWFNFNIREEEAYIFNIRQRRIANVHIRQRIIINFHIRQEES